MSVGLFAKLVKEAAPILENPSALKAAAQPAPQQQEENNPVYRSRHL